MERDRLNSNITPLEGKGAASVTRVRADNKQLLGQTHARRHIQHHHRTPGNNFTSQQVLETW